MGDLYKTLNVSRSSTKEEIRKSYLNLAKKYHPDLNPGDKDAEQKLKAINAAYDILGDEQKRSQYDNQQAHGGSSYGFSGGGGFGNSGAAEWASSYDMNDTFLKDVFEQIFGMRSHGASASVSQPGKTISYTVSLTLEEAFSGIETKIQFPTYVTCGNCNGKGVEEGGRVQVCAQCHGQGVNMRGACPKCRGQGFTIEKACPKCKGEGRARGHKDVSIKVPMGVDNDMVVVARHQGEAGIRGGPSGDLHVHIKVKAHKIFKRDGMTLICSYPLCMVQAALGATIDVPTIEGRKIPVSVPAGTQNGDRLRVAGYGMAIQGRARGDLYVVMEAYVPVDLSQEQKDLFKSFKEKEANKSPKARGLFSSIVDFFKKFSGSES